MTCSGWIDEWDILYTDEMIMKILIFVWAGIIVSDEVWIESTKVKMLACLNENHGMVNQVLHKCPASCENIW